MPSVPRLSAALACAAGILGAALVPCACRQPPDPQPPVLEQTVAFSVPATLTARPQSRTPTPSPTSTPCSDPTAEALHRFLAAMQHWVAEERLIADAWSALAYGPESKTIAREDRIDKLNALATRVGTVWHAVAELPAPEGCAPVRDQYVLALRKHHRFYLLAKSYVETQDEAYRDLANHERDEATRLRREVWGMLGDLEYWLQQHPCPGPDIPWPGLEGARSI